MPCLSKQGIRGIGINPIGYCHGRVGQSEALGA
jgi:hypothetical protein